MKFKLKVDPKKEEKTPFKKNIYIRPILKWIILNKQNGIYTCLFD